MKLTKEHIQSRVDELENSRTEYKRLAKEWDRMIRLDAKFATSAEEAIRKENREQIVTPLPQNTVNLAQRLISNMPDVMVPARSTMDERMSQEAIMIKRWLEALWLKQAQTHGVNQLALNVWYHLVRGKYVFDVKWIGDDVPRKMAKKVFPINIRALEPINVGAHMGPYYMEYAYHRYDSSLIDVLQRWERILGKAKAEDLRTAIRNTKKGKDEFIDVEVIDFWYVSHDDGSVWNAVLADGEFLKEPVETLYPEIPLVIGGGDFMPGIGDSFDGLSILHPLLDSWEYECRSLSQQATGVMWDFWPFIGIQNENNQPIDDIEVVPGMTRSLPFGTRIDAFHMTPNYQIAQQVFGQIDQYLQQATFPGVMYGQAPGELQAGYGVSLLSDAAKGRIKNFLESMELGIAKVNQIVLGIVESFAPDEGVSLFGRGPADKQPMYLTITPDMIDRNYYNEVKLLPQVPQDRIQEQTIGLQMKQARLISSQTYRDHFANIALPSDEEERVRLDEALESDELRAWRIRSTIMKYYNEPGDNGYPKWAEILATTPELLPPAPEGMQWTPDGTLEPLQPAIPGPGMGMGAGPGMMPPDTGMGGNGGMGMGTGAMSPGMGMQPPGMGTPMGGGIPPEMMGQITPDMMGINQQADPLAFQMAMQGGNIPQAELLAMLRGQPR